MHLNFVKGLQMFNMRTACDTAHEVGTLAPPKHAAACLG